MINNTTVTLEYSIEYPISDYDSDSYEFEYDVSSAEIVSLARDNPDRISSDDLDDDELFDAAIGNEDFMQFVHDHFRNDAIDSARDAEETYRDDQFEADYLSHVR